MSVSSSLAMTVASGTPAFSMPTVSPTSVLSFEIRSAIAWLTWLSRRLSRPIALQSTWISCGLAIARGSWSGSLSTPPRSTSQLAVSLETLSSSAISPRESPRPASSVALSMRLSTFFILAELNRVFDSPVVVDKGVLVGRTVVDPGDEIRKERRRERSQRIDGSLEMADIGVDAADDRLVVKHKLSVELPALDLEGPVARDAEGGKHAVWRKGFDRLKR